VSYRIAVDIGGTFTDLVCLDEDKGEVFEEKAHTTPADFAHGVLNVLDKSGYPLDRVSYFTHGTTVVINALTERKGARTALVTTKGFRDVLEIGRANRPDIYNLYYRKPKPFVRRALRFEVPERVDRFGNVLVELDEDAVRQVAARCREEGVEAVAVCFLHSYANADHEKRCREIIQEELPDVSVTISYDLTSEWREYERCSTAALNAYVQPAAKRYLDTLATNLVRKSLGVTPYAMQSNGGTASFGRAKETPINLVESGPVGGVIGASALGDLIGEKNIITLDSGGTTAKSSLISDGKVGVTTQYRIEWSPTSAGYPIKVPVVDVVEIGAGGGSIARIDEVGTLKVGPQSAGADPGPACYGKGGTEPTVTDANVIAGRIDPQRFLGGEFPLDVDKAEEAMSKISEHFGMSNEEAALGVIRLANANMITALKLVSLRRGYDPRDFTMVAIGGSGPVHAAALARELKISKVIVPRMPATFSAWGMLMTDLRQDFIRTSIRSLEGSDPRDLERIYAEMEEEALEVLLQQGVERDRVVFQRNADIRYEGQEHTVKTRVPSTIEDRESLKQIRKAFDDLHELHYSFKLEDASAQLVNFHLTGFGTVPKPSLKRLEAPGSVDDARRGSRTVDFDDLGRVETAVYDRALLGSGAKLSGPAVVEEAASVTVVFPDQTLEVDDYGNLVIRLEA